MTGHVHCVGPCVLCVWPVHCMWRCCPLCTGPGWGVPLSPSLPLAFPFPNTRILPRKPRRAVGQQVAAECSFGRGWVCIWDSARKGTEETLRNMVAASVEQCGWKSEQCNAWVLSLLANGHARPTGHGHQLPGCKLPEPESTMYCLRFSPFHELRTPPSAPAPPLTCRA